MASAQYSGWATAKRSYAMLFREAREALRAAGIWIVGLSTYPIVLSMLYGVVPVFATSMRWVWTYYAGRLAVVAFAYAATAVAWHRFVLQRRRPSLLPPLGRATLVYLITLFFLFLFGWIAPFVLFGLLLPVAEGSTMLLTLVPMLIALAMFAVTLRFALKLPAIAVDDASISLGGAWRLSRPIWGGLVWGAVVTVVPAFFLMQMVAAIWFELVGGNAIGSFIVTAFDWTIAFAGIILLATFLSLSYQFIVGDKDVGEVFA